jgi:type I restriction enzyme M protein
LRFASGDEDLRAALYEEFGDGLFTTFAGVAGALEQRNEDSPTEQDVSPPGSRTTRTGS